MTDTTSLRELIRGTLIQCYMDHPDYRLTTTLIDDMAAAVATTLAARAEPQAGELPPPPRPEGWDGSPRPITDAERAWLRQELAAGRLSIGGGTTPPAQEHPND